MNSTKGLTIALSSALVTLGLVGLFNGVVDPFRYYHGDQIILTKPTVNYYYEVLQKLLTHPDTESIILGSSRGQTTSPLWVERNYGWKTMNLSMGGAELLTKVAFINLALQKVPLKKVIWYADYFELIPETTDQKIKNTPAIRKLVSSDFPIQPPSLANQFMTLIDHSTTEAAMHVLKQKVPVSWDKGSGSGFDIEDCESIKYVGRKSEANLKKEAEFTFESYSRKTLKPPQSETYWELWFKKLQELSLKNIATAIVIPPYYSSFRKNLEERMPTVFQSHIQWRGRLHDIKIPNVRVMDFFDGIPGGDDSPRFWDDGVHFTCKGAIAMLRESLGER